MSEELRQNKGNKHKIVALTVLTGIGIVGAIAVFFYIQYKSMHISTDDAYIDGNMHTIAARVSGTIKQVFVSDNQYVRKGDIILELDTADYDAKMKEAESGLHAEESRFIETEVRLDIADKQLSESVYRAGAAKADLELQEANLKQTESDMKRAENLYKKEAISRERFEKSATARDVAYAQVKAAKDRLKQAETAVDIQKALIRQAESAIKSQKSVVGRSGAVLKSSELIMSYSKILAPADGYITRKAVQPGNQIQAGQPLLAVVPLDDVWVVANYKETQIEKIRPGQKVRIRVDTYPGKTFSGKVDSIMSGTGTVFSLFPPENATGNFVKVVQRIPVKIVLDKNSDEQHILRVGMSAEPTILLENK